MIIPVIRVDGSLSNNDALLLFSFRFSFFSLLGAYVNLSTGKQMKDP